MLCCEHTFRRGYSAAVALAANFRRGRFKLNNCEYFPAV